MVKHKRYELKLKIIMIVGASCLRVMPVAPVSLSEPRTM